MCGRYKLTTPTGKILEEFSVTGPRLNLRPRFNIAPTQDSLVIRRLPNGRQLSMMRWGLVPAWAKDTKMAANAINARAESVAVKPSFREALRLRRCLVVADGFYEWKPGAKVKQPYLFQLPSGGPFAFAGLYECWDKGDAPLETFTIICTDANSSIAPIHHRMPVILPAHTWEQWLNVDSYDAGAVLPLLETPSVVLTTTPVSRKLNAVVNDGPEVLEPELEREPQLF